MTRSEFLPYFQWHYFHSHNRLAPNILHFKVIDVYPHEGTYSTEVRVHFKGRVKWHKMILPLWNHASNNPQLLEEWNSNLQNGKIKKRKEFVLNTWLGKSKTGNTIRRFILEF